MSEKKRQCLFWELKMIILIAFWRLTWMGIECEYGIIGEKSTVRDYDDLNIEGSQRSAEEQADLSPGWNLKP